MGKAHHGTARSKRKRKGTRKAREREMVFVVRPDASMGPEDGSTEGTSLEKLS
jgi:hypothetical protein